MTLLAISACIHDRLKVNRTGIVDFRLSTSVTDTDCVVERPTRRLVLHAVLQICYYADKQTSERSERQLNAMTMRVQYRELIIGHHTHRVQSRLYNRHITTLSVIGIENSKKDKFGIN